MGACISAIAAVGSVFELSSGEPDLGMTTTGTILAVTVPLCLVCFLLAVKTSKQA